MPPGAARLKYRFRRWRTRFHAQLDDLNNIQAAQDGQVGAGSIGRRVGPEQDAGS
jgi:hypothetical protein